MAVDQGVVAQSRRSLLRPSGDRIVTAALLVLAAVGWWWTARFMDHDAMATGGMVDHSGMTGGAMSDDGAMSGGGAMSGPAATAMSLGTFLVGWVAMMAAMMLPSVAPVVGLYRRAVAAGRAAPLPVFLAGYLVVWSVPGVAAFWAWDRLATPLADGAPWAGRVAAAALLAAAAWQVGPVKSMCLAHCRSPLSFFLRHRGGLRRPVAALRLGLAHGGFCLGCCWLLMVVLVALGTMNLAWMAALAAVIFVEKVATTGPVFSRLTALGLAALGCYLLVDPGAVASVT